MRNALFLCMTVLVVAQELVHALDGKDETVPWTGYLIRLPWWVLMPAAVGFGGWLVWHLWDAKRKRERRA